MKKIACTAVIALLPMTLGACGFLFTHAPPEGHRQMNHFSCTENNAGPVIDLVWAGLNAAGAAIAASDETIEDRDQTIVVGLGWALLSGAAGFTGLSKTSECREAQNELARRLARSPTNAVQVESPIVGVRISPPTTTLSVGEQAQLVATAHDSSGELVPNTSFVWTSSNDAIASVSEFGLVTANAEGNVTIAARADGTVGTSRISVEGP